MSPTMITPVEEKKYEKIRVGLVMVSDGKSRPLPSRLALALDAVRVQRPRDKPKPLPMPLPHARERMVQIRRQRNGGLGLSLKGGAEHHLPVLISRIYQGQAADLTGQLFVGDAVIKVNGEFITACSHDDAVSILRDAGELVVLTVRHYRAATPFLLRQEGASDTDSSAGDEPLAAPLDDNCNPDGGANTNGGWLSGGSEGSRRGSTVSVSRPLSAGSGSNSGSGSSSACGEPDPHWTPDLNDDDSWVDVVTVPLMMGYVTRYVMGTDKLRPNAFEVVSARGQSTGVVGVNDPAALSLWLKTIGDHVVGLTTLQMKLFNRHLAAGDRIEHMGWVAEGIVGPPAHSQRYKPTFLVLKGTDVMLFEQPPMSVAELAKCGEVLKVYQTMFRVVRESEVVDWRPHCFLLQSGSGGAGGAGGAGPPWPRYCSVETRQELLRLEAAWTGCLLTAVVRLGRKTFTVVSGGHAASLTLDWSSGFSLSEGAPGAGAPPTWAYRFSQLRGSSDDGKSKLKLHFQDPETKAIETKELECQILQSLLFCMHAFLTAKVAAVDPAFLASMQQVG